MRPSELAARKPGRFARIVAALAAGIWAAWLHYRLKDPHHLGSDFGIVWFAARAMFHGVNPYGLVGPGLEFDWPWRLLYPGTAMVAASPFAILPQLQAAMAFVGVSAALMIYSLTSENWNRTLVLISVPFFLAAAAAQWSPLMTAAFSLPVVAVMLAAKPTIGLAIGAAAPRRAQIYGMIGGICLVAISLFFLPTWPRDWLAAISGAPHIVSPIRRFGGFLVLAALLRWRRPEARLLIAMALVPQTGSWYELVPLFLIPATLNESMILTITTSLGWLAQSHVLTATNEVEFNAQVGTLMILSGYVPCVIMVLLRPNEGTSPRIPSFRAAPTPTWQDRKSPLEASRSHEHSRTLP